MENRVHEATINMLDWQIDVLDVSMIHDDISKGKTPTLTSFPYSPELGAEPMIMIEWAVYQLENVLTYLSNWAPVGSKCLYNTNM